MNNTIMKFFTNLLSKINIKTSVLPIKSKLRQFVSRATDFGNDFRKLVCNVGDNGFKFACTDKVSIYG